MKERENKTFYKMLVIFTITLSMCISGIIILPYANAGDVYVNPGDDIQAAINGATAYDTIHFSAGTYNPSATININKPLTLLGPQAGVDPRPYAGSTRTPGDISSEAIIDGNGINRILYIDADDVIIDGLEVKDGTGDLIRQSNTHTGTIVRNCIVHDAINDEGIQLANCIDGFIEYNYIFDVAQDGANLAGSINCAIYKNEVTSSDSENGAIYVYESSEITIDSNYVHDTTAANGIELYENEGDITIKNNLVCQNLWEIKSQHHDYSGNAILGYKPTATGFTVTIAHNTLSDNAVGGASSYHYNEIGFGNGIGLNTVYPPYYGLNFDGIIDIYDNIISFNGLPSYGYGVITKIYYTCPGPSTVNVDYNDIYNNGAGTCTGTCTVGANNIYTDPMFVNAGMYDYHLQSGSSCIDSGITLAGISVDFEGNTRDANPDMGAYEYVCTAVCKNVGDNIEFCSIQAAIDASTTDDGETILVYAGTHLGNIIVYKELTIESQSGAASTIIDASTVDYSTYQNAWGKGINYVWAETFDLGLLKNGFMIWSDHVTIDGFSIINANYPTSYNRGIGVLIGSIHTTYAGFIPWNIDQWGGIVPSPDEPTPTGVIVKNNIIDGASDGIYNWASNGNIMEYNTISNTKPYAVGGVGIQCYEGGTDNIIRGNNIDNAADAISVCGAWPNILLDVSNTLVYDNILTNNDVGIKFYNVAGSGVAAYQNDIFTNLRGIVVEGVGGGLVPTAYDNNIVGNTNFGVQNTAPDGPFDAKCNWWGDISGPSSVGPGTGDAVSTNVYYCPWLTASYPGGSCIGGYIAHNIDKDTWYCCIQCAIDDANDYDTVEVIPGVHEEILTITRPITLLGATHNICKKGYPVPAGYAWDDTVETIIQPPAGHENDNVVYIYDVDDVTFKGFIVQALERGTSGNRMLVYVEAQTQNIENLDISNNVIGPNTNLLSQDGTMGRMNLDLDLNPYDASIGITDSMIYCNKIFDSKGNGDNVFIWGSYNAYGATGPSPMTNTYIENNEICGSHRSGIETAGGYTGLTIKDNNIHSNSGNPGDTVAALKYGTGILMIRGSSDKTCNGFGPDDLLIEGNDIHDNEKMGIYTGPIASDITILCNDIHDNGWDGIMLDLEGQYWNPQYEPGPGPYPCYAGLSNIIANCNNIYNNGLYGARVNGAPTNSFILDAECNWWGYHSGPYHPTLNPFGLGNQVSDNVDFVPYIFIDADAGGPYVVQGTYVVNFIGSGTVTSGCCGEVVTYDWDFGDGSIHSSLVSPTHSYTSYGTYTVTLTVTTTNMCGFSYTATDTTTAKCFSDPTEEPPVVILLYPEGGETLKGKVKVEWYAYDTQDEYDMPIYLYYYDYSWNQINGILENTGEYMWDTTSLPDGTYKLLVEAVDGGGNVGHDESEPFQIKNHDEPTENQAPNKPSRPSGPAKGKAGEEYTYSSSTSDSDGDQVWYMWDFGDGKSSGWLGPYNSGETCEASHVWSEKDDYQIKVKAKDEYGKESAWSDPFGISMPKNKQFINPLLQHILTLLIERFPKIAKVFTVLINLI